MCNCWDSSTNHAVCSLYSTLLAIKGFEIKPHLTANMHIQYSGTKLCIIRAPDLQSSHALFKHLNLLKYCHCARSLNGSSYLNFELSSSMQTCKDSNCIHTLSCFASRVRTLIANIIHNQFIVILIRTVSNMYKSLATAQGILHLV